MSLPEIRGVVLLTTHPHTGEAKTGDPYTSAFGKFQTWRRVDGEWQEGDSYGASLIAFGDAAAPLAAFKKGDKVELRGPASLGIWKDQPQFKVTVVACRVPVKTPKDATAPRQSVPA